ncbi:hypothetical protein Y882_06795 [Dyella japonica DSM 16301]|uniref:Uncharacterized protein n=1 Tax=Dyella japonica DSM 16301 TaxID=1440762 RepID=A0A0G9H3Z6_9GAMM|nr:hypothetical protein Y882_06795 [Dyella japonica DSM 16301]
MTKISMFSEQTNEAGRFRHDEVLISEIEAFQTKGSCVDTPRSSALQVAARRRRMNAVEARQRSRWLPPLFRIY